MPEYETQYGRMLRWMEKIEDVVEGGGSEISKEEFEDLFVAYFQTCYHVKDYLKNDSKVGVSEPDVRSFIDTNDCMAICADICNSTKHLKLKSAGRSDENPVLDGGKHVTISVGESATYYTMKVEADSGEIDAYKLATECKEAWDNFLQSNGLSVPE